MLRNEWNAIALNVDEKSPRRNEAALAERQLAYTQKILEKADLIREYWSKIPDENKKSFHQVMADFMALVWHYYAIDNATYRFWGKMDECILGYFGQRMYKNDIASLSWQREWERFHLEAEKSNRELICIIDNKRRFREYFGGHGLPVCLRLGTLEVQNEELTYRDAAGTEHPVASLWNGRESIFCKPELESQGRGCFRLDLISGQYVVDGKKYGEQDLKALFEQPRLVEEVLVNHNVLHALHPASLNTCRFITIREHDGGFRVLRAVMRMGVGGSTVDNWCHGGLAVEIKPDGCLAEFAQYEDYAIPDTRFHPDSGIVFQEVKIPYYSEAVELALEAHRLCRAMKSVGWDIAITKNGPVLVEGNVFYESFQAVCGGLRPEMARFFVQ